MSSFSLPALIRLLLTLEFPDDFRLSAVVGTLLGVLQAQLFALRVGLDEQLLRNEQESF